MEKNRNVGLVMTVIATLLLFVGSAVAGEKEHTMKVGKKGDVTFAKAIQVGDLTLKPGRYILQHRVEGENHYVHFTELTKGVGTFGTGGGAPKAHPGEVKCKLEPLSTKVEGTTVYFNTEGGVSRLTKVMIAGENVAHVL